MCPPDGKPPSYLTILHSGAAKKPVARMERASGNVSRTTREKGSAFELLDVQLQHLVRDRGYGSGLRVCFA